MTEMDNASKLLELAKRRFGTLSKAEKKFFEAVAKGEIADFSADSEEESDPAGAENWGDERALNADRVAWLCTDPEASALVTQRGIWVEGVRIDGELDLKFVRVPFPLYCKKSSLLAGIVLENAKIRGLYFLGTHTGPISADGLKVEGDVFLRNGFKAKGMVRLNGSTINGNLDCNNGYFTNPNGQALSADGAKVSGCVFLREGFKAEGEVRLLGATIGGDLSCINGHFTNPKGNALSADGAKVSGCVFLRDGFEAEGQVRLLGAIIGGSLDCNNGHFTNPNGNALNADRVKVSGSIFLREGFKAEGEVRLLGATIGGDLSCINGHFTNPGGDALSAERMKVEGSVFLRDSFETKGRVSLMSATVGGYFIWTNLASPTQVTLDLRSARVGTLWDDEPSWPESGNLLLHGLVYDEIHDKAPTDAKTRIKWLRRQPNKPFRSQPYEQLAAVLRKSGHDADARTVLFTKAKDRAKVAQLKFHERLWHRFLGLTIGYGYRPWQALWIALAVIALGWAFFAIGNKAEVITPTKVATYESAGSGEDRRISEDYPGFCSLVYSLDVFVPLVDLQQASYWLPNANLRGEWRMFEGFTLPVCGRILRIYFWFQIIAGWALSTLLAVGLSGLVKR